MSDSSATFRRLEALSASAHCGELTDAEFADLEIALGDDDACQWYRDFYLLQAELWFLEKADKADRSAHERLRRQSEGDAPAGPSPAPPVFALVGRAIHGTIGYFPQDVLLANLIAAVLVGFGLLLAANVYVSEPEPLAQNSQRRALPAVDSRPQPVCRVTGMVDCRWEKKGLGIRDWGLDKGAGDWGRGSGFPSPAGRGDGGEGGQSLVCLGDKFALASGLLQLTYQSGAKVILQGPCTYEVDSAVGGFLSLGKLTAKVESGQWPVASAKPQAANQKSEIRNHESPSLSTTHYPLFTINTPTAVVTDLGTEFGVEVSKDGCTTSRVYRGSVNLQAASADGMAAGASQVLHENQSARVERSGNQGGATRIVVLGPSFKLAGFVREIPKLTIKTLDLADVVAGGDGFTGRRNRGINPTDGRIAEALRGQSDPAAQSPWSGDGQYHRVTGMPFVDGVFIPDGSKDKVQVDSGGHVFDGFRGSTNATWQPVWAGGPIPADVSTKVGDIDYASSGHGLIYLAASNAITFDLEAIRQANPGFKLLRFLAAAANTKPDECEGCADIWVLIDGEWRFRRRQINNLGVYSVLVPIRDKDRFLTLASTDGGDGISHDWIIFGDPRLELLPVETNQQKDTEGH